MTSRSYPNYPFDKDPVGTLEKLLSQAEFNVFHGGLETRCYWYANRLADGFLFISSPAGHQFWYDIVNDLRSENREKALWALYRAKIELMSWLERIR